MYLCNIFNYKMYLNYIDVKVLIFLSIAYYNHKSNAF